MHTLFPQKTLNREVNSLAPIDGQDVPRKVCRGKGRKPEHRPSPRVYTPGRPEYALVRKFGPFALETNQKGIMSFSGLCYN